MTTQFTRFRIEGLHNRRTIDVPIKDNRLVLVGENGTGKSTVANFMYYFLTTQWSRMLDTTFKTVIATLNGTDYAFTKDTIQKLSSANDFLKRGLRGLHLPSIVYREIEAALELEPEERRIRIDRLESDLGIPARILNRELARFREFPSSERSIVREMRNEIEAQILYLPTYRRIEQDLKTIFPDADIERLQKSKITNIGRGGQSGHIELVEFGMEDVEHTIQMRMAAIKDKVRQDLSNLTGAYLRDIIQGAYRKVSPDLLRDFDPDSVDDVFKRIPPEILPDKDKVTLKQIITEINVSGVINDENRVTAHFLSKLFELYERQQEDERDIREFVSVCNERYLTGKRFVYDDASFNVFIEQQGDADHVGKLPIQALSSGEKQIVSLFSHLYLSGSSNFLVIIDEPELSLSVPWQRHFLPDILGRSMGLIAVTHSPFIFENELEQYAHSLQEFTLPFQYDPDLETLIALDEEIPF